MATSRKSSSNKLPTSLTTNEVNQVLDFATGLYQGVFTPYTQNQLLISLTQQPLKADYEKISKALKNYLTEPEALKAYSQFMSIFDTIYGKTLRYFENMLSFDLSYSCTNIKDTSEYKSKEYKEDLYRVHKFLDKFDYKREFKKILKLILREDVFYGWFRDSYGTISSKTLDIKNTEKFAIQTMPQDYCMITGYSDDSILYDFDMAYFLQSTVDIRLYDPSFVTKYNMVFNGETDWHYDPAAQYNNRTGTYAFWTQVSPDDGMICVKYNDTDYNIVPPFASLMKEVFNNTNINKLQLDKDIISAYAILYGSIGTYDNAKSGTQPNQFKIAPKNIGKFMSLVASGLENNLRPVALPLDETKFDQYQDYNPNMLTTAISSSSAQGASASSLIYTTNKMSQSELIAAITNDYNTIKVLYPQFESILNRYINKKLRKYHFNFTFSGSNYLFEREDRCKHLLELADHGIVLGSSQWASAYGYKPQEFYRAMEEGCYGDFTDKLKIMVNRNTMNSSNQSSNSGRPQTSQEDLGDAGETSRDYK
jgi:hypothetical protein